MPRYFFHVDNSPSHRDHEGVELKSERDANIEAVAYAAQLLRDSGAHFLDKEMALRIRIKDESGKQVGLLEVRTVNDTPGDRELSRRGRSREQSQ